ncbi:MAG: hypothetical protein JXX28_04180 [Deltaproteobacteria bacterium]|nr:hypothetical protein [Deltaproteobacteria bacterium]
MGEPLRTGRLSRLGRLATLGPRTAVAALRQGLGAEDSEAVGQVLEETLGQLKAGSLKLGQIFAQVADDLPAASRARLGRLYAQAPPMPGALAVLDSLPPGAFSSFEPEPFAAASLGQVHAARLVDGTEVAVKLQYPGVGEALRADLDLLGRAATTVTGGGALVDVSTYLTAICQDLMGELDYLAEADRRDLLAETLAAWDDLVVPRVHRDLSGPTALTLDLLGGPTLHQWCDSGASPAARQRVAERLLRAVVGPPLAGVVNADAHPGNFVVREGSLGLLDFGAVRPYAHADGLRALLEGLLITPAPTGCADRLAAAGFVLDLPTARRARFAQQVADVLRPLFAGPYNFEQRSAMKGLGLIKQRHPLDTLHLHLSSDAIALMRALLGLHHGLRRLAVPVDLAPALRQVLECAPPRALSPR